MTSERKIAAVCFALVALLLMASVARAGKAATLSLGSETRSTGYESGLVTSRTPADCFVTDDWDLRLYGGTLGPGQVFEDTFNFCWRADVVLRDGAIVTSNHESLRAELNGRGQLRLEVVSALGTYGVEMPDSTNSRDHWRGCGLFDDRQQDASHWYGGAVVVRVTNEGSRVARDITLLTEVNLDASGLRSLCGS